MLTDLQIANLKESDRLKTVLNRAIRFLSYRPRSVQEVRRYLTSKGFSEDAVEATLSHLEEASLLDDRDFADYWVEQRCAFRPRSIAMLRHELRLKGVPTAAIAAALKGLDEDELAYEAARRFAGRVSSLPQDQYRRKLTGHLARRGFPYSAIESAISRLQVRPDTQQDEHNRL